MAEDLIARLRKLSEAYPPDVFGPVSDEEIKANANLITRNSAAMGRHFSSIFKQAADRIERLENALYGEVGLVELITTRDDLRQERLAILANHRHVDARAALENRDE